MAAKPAKRGRIPNSATGFLLSMTRGRPQRDTTSPNANRVPLSMRSAPSVQRSTSVWNALARIIPLERPVYHARVPFRDARIALRHNAWNAAMVTIGLSWAPVSAARRPLPLARVVCPAQKKTAWNATAPISTTLLSRNAHAAILALSAVPLVTLRHARRALHRITLANLANAPSATPCKSARRVLDPSAPSAPLVTIW